MPDVEEGIEVIVRDHIPLPGLAEDGKHDELDFVAKEPAFEMAAKGHDGGVVFVKII